MKQSYDIAGQRFGRLTVIVRQRDPKDGKMKWRCQCDCGRERLARGTDLRRGIVKSCGCMKTRYANGERKTRLYSIWVGMNARCGSPNSPRYMNYGAKGIRVCEDWKRSFLIFQKWAESAGYTDELTIDRIDNSGDYEPNNCRWTTVKVQNNNRSTCDFITAFGKTQTLSQWAAEKGIKQRTLYSRIHLQHWPIEKALTQSVQKHTKSAVSK